ncbi:glutathione S-transferase [Pseudovirgaria hyperparasitica]|uniref:Glutathione S-transferase n=1 Tax=Pseudovirgaria hyperparasitica TaxID=470096 RepID=A0A6A6W8M3_9PEZI|nr:glutathione S-transferase [Pseudovirgaria hyperparasitica]KAF2757431.1 glutathione S-transferase [Pseudovirgaria hyperparasitica]
MSKPITLYGHAGGPNPWKVVIFLEELGIAYDMKIMDFGDLKKEPYESINPNGRVPAIEDPNTGIQVWESGAIIDYLIETYDKSGKFATKSSQDKWTARALRDFQMSGQGPYTGQKVWFTKFHPEKVPSAVERYGKETVRNIGVIEKQLKKSGGSYLLGNDISYADLMFVPWYWYNAITVPEGTDLDKEFPSWSAWYQKLSERPSVKKAAADRTKAMGG